MTQIAHQRGYPNAGGNEDQIQGLGFQDIREAPKGGVNYGQIPGAGLADGGGNISRGLNRGGVEGLSRWDLEEMVK